MKNMKKQCGKYFGLAFTALAVFTWATQAGAQPFTYATGDLILTFRKVGAYQENYEAVADIGQATNYVNLPIGATITVPHVAPTQLVPNSFVDFNNLKWAVVGGLDLDVGNYPGYALWLTVPRSRVDLKTRAAPRLSQAEQSSCLSQILSITDNASFISNTLGTSNDVNNVYFVREAWADFATRMLSDFMGGANVTIGTLGDTWVNNDLEKTTPGSFTNSYVRSDLYEIRPIGLVDPHTTLTNGPAYYVGYFQFNWDGTITFTRDVPKPKLSLARAGNVNTISFSGYTSATTYRLLFTSDPSTPASSWSALPGSVTGDWTNQLSFQDTTSDPLRFYGVQAQ